MAGRTTGAFDPTKPNAGGGDVFVTKRRTDDGSEVVSRQFGKAGEDGANGLAYDWSSGKVVVAGTTDGSLFDTPNAGGIDGFVAKVDYNESGGDSDTAAPYAPTIDLAAISDTGSSNTDNLTNNATPKLTGSAEPTSTIKVKDGATLLGTTTTTTAGAWSFSTTTPLSDGAHQLTATATDTANNESAVSATLTVNVDTTVPAPTSPSHAFTTPTQLSPSAVPVLLSWPASSDASGIERYELRQSTDGGSTFTNVALSSQNQTNRSYTAMLAPGTTTYLFEARAVDKAGNGSWTRGSGFKVGDYPETSTSVVYAGKGWNAGSATSFFGGTSKYASAASNTATLTFTNAKQVGWVTTVGPSRGNAKLSLYEGTTLLASVTKDTYASALQYRQLLYSRSGLDSTKTYKLVVEVLGTKNTASTSTRVDIDSFVVIR